MPFESDGLSCVNACCGCRGINCYNETVDKKGNVFDDDFENYDNLF